LRGGCSTCDAAQAKDKWINLTTKNFNIISNADEGETRKLSLKLEQFITSFETVQFACRAPNPTTVMVFKNDGSFKPYKPLYNGKPATSRLLPTSQDENLLGRRRVYLNHRQRPLL